MDMPQHLKPLGIVGPKKNSGHSSSLLDPLPMIEELALLPSHLLTSKINILSYFIIAFCSTGTNRNKPPLMFLYHLMYWSVM